MSKSAASMAGVIELLDSPDATIKKFKSSVTDAGKEIKFDEKEKPGISNLLTFIRHFLANQLKILKMNLLVKVMVILNYRLPKL